MSERAPSYIFKLNEDGTGPEILREVLYDKGWVEYDDTVHAELQWNLWWKTTRFRTSEYGQLLPWQRINHCPKATEHAQYWICKPADMSRGRGIFIIRELGELQYDTNSIVQQYISQPYLIHGHKFDLRLYAVVTSYHPLRLYLYHDGLVRFSCEKYDLSALSNMYSHLTNTSINRGSSFYAADKAGIGLGSKWTLKQLRHYFYQKHVDDSDLWWRIIAIVSLTIIPQTSEVPRADNCFELYGFDILIDRDLKPWLLEVNFSPSLSYDGAVDSVKKDMLSDLIDLLDYGPCDRHQVAEPHAGQSSRSRYLSTSGRGLATSCRPVTRSTTDVRTRAARTTPGLPRIPSSVRVKPRSCVSVAGSSDMPASDDECADDCGPIGLPGRALLSCSSLSLASLGRSSTIYQNTRRKKQPRSRSSSLSDHPGVYQQSRRPWQQDPHRAKMERLDLMTNGDGGEQDAGLTVGGFHRIYPFNQTTRTKSLSSRQMVMETHQMIRSKLRKTAEKTKSVGQMSEATELVNPFPSFS